MKKLLTLAALATLAIGCANAPFEPSEPEPSLLAGVWGGEATVVYPGPADEQLERTTIISISFKSDGTFEYYEYRDGSNMMPGPDILYEGTFSVDGDSVRLSTEYDFLFPSPLDLNGAFGFKLTDDSLSAEQIIGDLFPVVHRLRLVPWETIRPLLRVYGFYLGISTVTYPGAADEPISDSLMVNIFFGTNGKYILNAAGDSLTDPYYIEGTFVVSPDTVYLSTDQEITIRTPLYLKGAFAWRAEGDRLELLQQPPHIWPDIYSVRLIRQYHF